MFPGQSCHIGHRGLPVKQNKGFATLLTNQSARSITVIYKRVKMSKIIQIVYEPLNLEKGSSVNIGYFDATELSCQSLGHTSFICRAIEAKDTFNIHIFNLENSIFQISDF